MNALARLEAFCATVVEQTFARVFPSALEPAQIARKLVATIERAPPAAPEGSRYTIRLSEADFAALAAERPLLEQQWTKMAGALCARAGLSAPAPAIALVADGTLANGSILIDKTHPEADDARPRALRVERGVPVGKTIALPHASGSLVIGRDPACGLVVFDPRVSRRHVRLDLTEASLSFEDLGSANGTLRNGVPLASGELREGDRLSIGDTTLIVERAAASR